jgi:endoglucanase
MFKIAFSHLFCLGALVSMLEGTAFELLAAGETLQPAQFDNQPNPVIIRGFQVASIRSPESTKDFSDVFLEIKAWGANGARLQLKPHSFSRRVGKDFWAAWPDFLDTVEAVVKKAEDAGLKLIPVLMEGPHYGEYSDPEMWGASDLQEGYGRIWRDLATRLATYKKAIWAYDILNEPLDRTQLPFAPRQWRPLAISILRAIRAVDQNAWIVYETGPGSLFSGFDKLVPLPDPHVIYSAHFYYPQRFTHQGIVDTRGTDMARAIKEVGLHYPGFYGLSYFDKEKLAAVLKPADEFQAKWRVPIYVGEFSVVRWAPSPDAEIWLRDVIDLFESRHWSWTYHAFREYTGWSLEHGSDFSTNRAPAVPSSTETERGIVVKEALARNGS